MAVDTIKVIGLVDEAQFTIGKLYLWILILSLLLVAQYTITLYGVTMRARIAVMRGNHMKKFLEEHKRAFPDTRPPEFGYPDVGSGRFAKALPYADWFRFNNGQRCQINFLEHLTYALVGPLIVGLVYPHTAAVFAIMIAVGRLLFTIGYSTGGPNRRIAGALIMDVALLAMFGYICVMGWNKLKGQ